MRTISGHPSVRWTQAWKAALVASVVLGLITVSALAFAVLAPQPAAAAEEPAVQVEELVDDVILPPGSTVESEAWSIRLGAIEWGQNEAVDRASTLNPRVQPGMQWVTLPVEVTNKLDVSVSATSLEVALLAGNLRMSHRFKATQHYPSSTLPEELDIDAIAPGEVRKGNVGWLVRSETGSTGICLLEVYIDHQEFLVACDVQAQP